MQEVTGAWLPCQHHGGHVPDDLLLLTLCHWCEPLLQTQLPLATKEQQEAHLTTHRYTAGSVVMHTQADGVIFINTYTHTHLQYVHTHHH